MTAIEDKRIVINNGLARIGAAPVGSLSENTPKLRQVLAVYDDRLDSLFACYEWSFNARTYKLDAVPQTAPNDYIAADKSFMTGWRHAHYLPGTRLGLPRRILTNPRAPDNPLRQFAIEADRVYADVTPLWATVPVRADPELWLPAFRLAAVIALASDFCVPIAHDKNLAEQLRAQSLGSPEENGRGGLVGQAIAIDHARARTKAPLQTDPLSDARLS